MKTTYVIGSRYRHHNNGFTLVELLVVMFIIATLASIGFGIFFRLKDSAKEKETVILLKNIRSNMEAVKAETGTPYPDTAAELYSYLTGTYAYTNPDYEVKPAMPELLPDQAGSKFVKGSLLVDSWRREIEYTYPGVRNNFEDGFDLKSDGIDATDEGDDIEL